MITPIGFAEMKPTASRAKVKGFLPHCWHVQITSVGKSS